MAKHNLSTPHGVARPGIPDKALIREIVVRDTLGGAEMHSTVSKVSDHFGRGESQAIAKTCIPRVEEEEWEASDGAEAQRDEQSRNDESGNQITGQ